MYGILKNPRKVGALAPSSPFLARAMAESIDALQRPSTILEIGAGTGHITERIMKKVQNDDCVDIIELNPDYCTVLNKRFGHYDKVNLFCGSILEWKPDYHYDLIICTLPFNGFKVDLVDTMIAHIKHLAKPQSLFCYVALCYLKPFKKLLLSRQDWHNNQLTTRYMQDFNKRYCYKTVKVFRNIPPAQVHYCTLS